MSASPREMIQFLARSPDRLIVLTAIEAKPSTRAELHAMIGIHRSTLSRILDELVERELAVRSEGRYAVTIIGGSLVRPLGALLASIETIRRLEALVRHLSAAQPSSNGYRSGGEVIASTASDPTAPSRRFLDLLQSSVHPRLLLVPGVCEAAPPFQDGNIPVDRLMPHLGVQSHSSALGEARSIRIAIADARASPVESHGDLNWFLGQFDHIVVVGVTDGACRIQGMLEWPDEASRVWIRELIASSFRGTSIGSSADLTS